MPHTQNKQFWHQKMREDKTGKCVSIAENFDKDECLSHDLMKEFWLAIDTSGITCHNSAHDAAIKVLNSQQKFKFAGNKVPSHKMLHLMRVENLKHIAENLTDSVSAELALSGLSKVSLQNVKILKKFSQSRNLEIFLGMHTLACGVAWCTEDMKLTEENIQKLALNGSDSKMMVAYCYDRGEVPNGDLFVPRCLDAINNPNFLPQADCAAETGLTRSNGVLPGLVEAIHKPCSVSAKIKVIEIQ